MPRRLEGIHVLLVGVPIHVAKLVAEGAAVTNPLTPIQAVKSVVQLKPDVVILREPGEFPEVEKYAKRILFWDPTLTHDELVTEIKS